jgi:ribosomal protein L32
MNKVDEWCPKCEQEVELMGVCKKTPTKCPNCGEMILPCSLCTDKDMKCELCLKRKEIQNG